MTWRRIIISSRGFTLLEVMIAMTIMVVAFGSIFAIQGNSLKAAERSKRMNVIGMLAKSAMVLTEIEIMGKTFNEVEKEKSGQFEAPYEDYSWTREIKEVEFPALNFAAGKEKEREDNPNGAMQEQMGKMMASYLKKALREITVTVKWQLGSSSRSYAVSMYWIDTEATFDLN